jgi:hypothetical protein
MTSLITKAYIYIYHVRFFDHQKSCTGRMCFKLEYTEALIRRTYVKRQTLSNGQLFEHSFLYKYRPISRQLKLKLCKVIAFLGWTTF